MYFKIDIRLNHANKKRSNKRTIITERFATDADVCNGNADKTDAVDSI